MQRLLAHGALVLAGFCYWSSSLHAQTAPLGRPSEQRVPLAPGPLDATPVPGLKPSGLPPVPALPPGSAAGGIRIFVQNFVFEGNAVIATAELEALAAPYHNREISSDDLDALRRAVTDLYVARGFINSGALIPDQNVAAGTIRIQIVEGRLTDVVVRGNQRLKSRFVSERLLLGAGPPLDINDLQERLQLLVANPAVERVNADLQPGVRPGEARLEAEIVEAPPGSATLTFDNHVSPSVGGLRGVAEGRLLNPLGIGDAVSGSLAFAEGLVDFSGQYAVPVTPQDTTVALFGTITDSRVVEAPFDRIRLQSETRSVGLRVSHPIINEPRNTLTLSAELVRRSSQTFVLGVGFPFSAGVEPDGESKVSVLRFSQDWVKRDTQQVIAGRSTFSWGLPLLAQTEAASARDPDGRFFAWLGQFQWVRRVEATGGQLSLRADAQLSLDPLLPLEQYATGGALSVRGYRENQLVYDQGYSASLEYRHPVLFDGLGRDTLQLATFFDYGDGWNKNRITVPGRRSISSFGFGALWTPNDALRAEVYWAVPLRDVDGPHDDLQDSGIHFRLVATPFD